MRVTRFIIFQFDLTEFELMRRGKISFQMSIFPAEESDSVSSALAMKDHISLLVCLGIFTFQPKEEFQDFS